MKSEQIREEFLKYFEEKGHLRLPSSSLIPSDPTLLLTAAGMVQFKPYFLGLSKPPSARITTVQKCVRTSDIERVGETARHLTFFEMLGNFSFGDYFKKEAMSFAIEFLFDRMGLNRDRFWATVYEEDDEAFELWVNEFGFPVDRVIRLGKDDNFWEAGSVGPCGPCSELIIDRGEEFGCGSPECKPGCDCDRFLEIWNLVFMQYNKDEKGKLTPLPKKNIDTGMGLERISLVKQDVATVFETDLLFPIIEKIAEISGEDYGKDSSIDKAFRIIADHIKASSFLIGDGLLPSNEGRGYVLRRLIRRSLSYSRRLGIEGAFIEKVAEVVINRFGGIYTELKDNDKFILSQLKTEEKRFLNVMEKGIEILEESLNSLSVGDILPASVLFKLYDTYGFPVELTAEIATEKGFKVDLDGFYTLLEERKEESRKSWTAREFIYDKALYDSLASEFSDISFEGYEKDETEADVLAIITDGKTVSEAEEGTECELILNRTTFYPEGGGQVSDTGEIIADDSSRFEVKEVRKPSGNLIVHHGRVVSGKIKTGMRVKTVIDKRRRRNTERNHTATHLLHWALRLVLGESVKQSGSFVGPDYFRFDYPFERPLTEEEISKIEDLINRKIAEAHPVKKFITTLDTARELGAIALFGEKYGDYVRVVECGDFSRELCGGTHTTNTGMLGMFLIRSERGIGSGLRRIEAITGEKAIEYAVSRIRNFREISKMIRTSEETTIEAVCRLIEENERFRKQLEHQERMEFRSRIEEILSESQSDDYLILKEIFRDIPLKDLKEIVDIVRSKNKYYALVIGTVFEEKPSFYVALSKNFVERGLNASEIAREAAKKIKGGGGGSPLIADAGGKDINSLPEAVEHAYRLILEKLKNS